VWCFSAVDRTVWCSFSVVRVNYVVRNCCYKLSSNSLLLQDQVAILGCYPCFVVILDREELT
jgi:hypothetical protein